MLEMQCGYFLDKFRQIARADPENFMKFLLNEKKLLRGPAWGG